VTGCSRGSLVLGLCFLGVLAYPVGVRAQEEGAGGDEQAAEGKKDDTDASQKKKKSNLPMRKVLDHKKQFVLYPRFGYLKVLGGSEEIAQVDHASLGFDLQVGLKRKFYVSAETQLLYISSGEYGISYSKRNDTIERYGENNFTALFGLGMGVFTKFLDNQELWTHAGIKVGYLHPFYVPVWLAGDIEKEFRRTKGSYWVITGAPMAGVLIPLRDPVVRANYAPVDPEAPPDSGGGPAIRFMLGAQVSVAFIFAPRS